MKNISQEQEIRLYKKKEDIYREGSFPKGVFFLNKGKVIAEGKMDEVCKGESLEQAFIKLGLKGDGT